MTSDLSATAVIQARMSSTRFAGKILSPVFGQPLLWHIITRLQACELVEKIVIATSREESDDPVEEFAAAHDIPCVRGSLSNVLSRFSIAMQRYPARYIVRICGDSPLIDAHLIEDQLRELARVDGDYALFDDVENSIVEGFDVFSSRLLSKLETDLKHEPAAQEHVVGCIKVHPDICTPTMMPLSPDYRLENVKTSIDTPADVRFVEALYARSGSKPGMLDLRDAVSLINRDPELLKINGDVRKKHPSELTRRVLIKVDGDKASRHLAMARRLELAQVCRENLSWGVTFASGDGEILAMAEAERHRTCLLSEDNILGAFDEAVSDIRPDIIILSAGDGAAIEGPANWYSSVSLVTVVGDDSKPGDGNAVWAISPDLTLHDISSDLTINEALALAASATNVVQIAELRGEDEGSLRVALSIQRRLDALSRQPPTILRSGES